MMAGVQYLTKGVCRSVTPFFGNRLRTFRAFLADGLGFAIAALFDLALFDYGPVALLNRDARHGDGNGGTFFDNDLVLSNDGIALTAANMTLNATAFIICEPPCVLLTT